MLKLRLSSVQVMLKYGWDADQGDVRLTSARGKR